MAKTKFEVYKDKKGEFRWKLLSQNNEPVATGAEGYKEKRSAMNAVKKLSDWANTENIVDVEKAKEEAKKVKADPAKSTKKVQKKVVAKTTTKKVATKKAVKKSAPAPKKAPVKKVQKKVVAKTTPVVKKEESSTVPDMSKIVM